MATGASAAVAGVGNEGMLGVSLFMGGDATPSSAVVQTAERPTAWSGGCSRRNSTATALHGLLLRYTQALMAQMTQTAVCNRHHLGRSATLPLAAAPPSTAFLSRRIVVAGMLGVHGEGIAGRSRRPASSRTSAPHIAVLERAGLETRVCECYAVVRNEFRRLLYDRRRRERSASG